MGKQWIREELVKAAKRVAVSLGGKENEVASADNLAALARAWGVEVRPQAQPGYLTVCRGPYPGTYCVMTGDRDAPGPERQFCLITNCSLEEAMLLVERCNANS